MGVEGVAGAVFVAVVIIVLVAVESPTTGEEMDEVVEVEDGCR